MSSEALSLLNQLTANTRRLSEIVPEQEEQLRDAHRQITQLQAQLKQVQTSLTQSQAEVTRLNESILRLTESNMQLRTDNDLSKSNPINQLNPVNQSDRANEINQISPNNSQSENDEIARMLDDDDEIVPIPMNDAIETALNQSKRLRHRSTLEITAKRIESGLQYLGDARSCLKAVETVPVHQMPSIYIDELAVVLSTRIQSLLVGKNNVNVRELITELFALRPKWYKSHALMGTFQSRNGQTADALKSFEEALTHNPPAKDAVKLEAKRAMLKKQLEKAELSTHLPSENNQSTNKYITQPANQLTNKSTAIQVFDESNVINQSINASPNKINQSFNASPNKISQASPNAPTSSTELRSTDNIARAFSPQPMSPRPRALETIDQSVTHDWTMFPRITDIGIMDFIGFEAFSYAETEHKTNLHGGLRCHRSQSSHNPILESRFLIVTAEKPSKKRKLDVENDTPVKQPVNQSPFGNSQDDVKKYRSQRIEFVGNRVHAWRCSCEDSIGSSMVYAPCRHIGVTLMNLRDKQQAMTMSSTHPSMFVHPTQDYSRISEYGTYFESLHVNSSVDRSISSLLSANHLPATGVKSLLVARCVDAAVHGVGKSCPNCGARTFWANGAWRCKGKFDPLTKQVDQCSWKAEKWATTPWREQ